jgi:hypothetical protein
MAYGNWGAFVYKNGQRMSDWQDQTPYRETELQQGYWQAFGPREGLVPHHAVLGEGRVRLCGYKCYPVLFLDGNRVEMKEMDDEYAEDEGDLEGFHWSYSMSDNQVELRLLCPNGDLWNGTSGYGMGTGYEDEE